MGGAFAAVAADASTVYWNPAGIAGMEKRQVLLMHAEQFGDLLNYNFGAYVQPTTLVDKEKKPAFGFALIHLGDPDQILAPEDQYKLVDQNGQTILVDNNGNVVDPDLLTKESNNSFAGFGSFAIETGAGNIGGTLKLIYQDFIADESSMGIGIDLGYLHRDFLTPNLAVAAKLQDATGTYISWSTGTNEFVVPSLVLGSAYKVNSAALNGSVLLAVDADIFFDDRQIASQFWAETVSTDLRVGLELSFQDKVMIRGGLDAVNPTAGAGLYFGMFGFDYAYLHHDDFESTHRVSLLATF
jgi:long-subunit fatty acid transport protein